MQNKIIIIGAGGHGKVAADLALQCHKQVAGYLDDHTVKGRHFGFPILGGCLAIGEVDCAYVIAIGNNAVRRNIARSHGDAVYAALVHPAAVMGKGAEIGAGTLVMPQAVLNADAKVGCHCIINTGAIVEHDCRIGDFTHISPGAVLAGSVSVGAECQIGAGAAVINNITICSGVTVGAGAVVVKDITEPGVYLGVPAQKR